MASGAQPEKPPAPIAFKSQPSAMNFQTDDLIPENTAHSGCGILELRLFGFESTVPFR